MWNENEMGDWIGLWEEFVGCEMFSFLCQKEKGWLPSRKGNRRLRRLPSAKDRLEIHKNILGSGEDWQWNIKMGELRVVAPIYGRADGGIALWGESGWSSILCDGTLLWNWSWGTARFRFVSALLRKWKGHIKTEGWRLAEPRGVNEMGDWPKMRRGG